MYLLQFLYLRHLYVFFSCIDVLFFNLFWFGMCVLCVVVPFFALFIFVRLDCIHNLLCWFKPILLFSPYFFCSFYFEFQILNFLQKILIILFRIWLNIPTLFLLFAYFCDISFVCWSQKYILNWKKIYNKEIIPNIHLYYYRSIKP